MATAFAQAMAAKAKVFKKAASAKPRKGSSFGPVNIPTGQYEAQISCKYGVGEKGKLLGKMWVELVATVSDGPHLGKEPKQFYVLEGKEISDEPDAQMTAEQKLVGDLKQILPDIDIEGTLQEEPAQLEAILKEVNNRSPKMNIGIRNSEGKPGTRSAGKSFQDVYFNDLIEGGANNGSQEESETSGQEEGEEAGEEEGEEEGGEPDTGDDDAVDYAPAKEDKVMYQPKGAKAAREFTVKTVNQNKRTVSVSDGKKKFSEVSWDSITPVDPV